MHGGSLDRSTRVWRIWETAAYLEHLVSTGRVSEQAGESGASRFSGA